jgi:hypothetical protein
MKKRELEINSLALCKKEVEELKDNASYMDYQVR